MNSRIAIFLGIMLLTLSAYMGVRGTANEVASRLNTQYSKILTEACRTATERMEYDESGYAVMATKDVRESVIDAFFNTFLISFEEATAKDGKIDSEPSINRMILYKNIPVILLMDVNGFYVWYNTFENDMLTSKMSSLTSYSKTISGSDIYYIRFFLGNRVQVSKKGEDIVYDGTPKEVYKKLGCPSELIFLSDYEKYAAYRNEYVADLVEDQVEYYINNENLERQWTNSDRSDYVFEMPQISMSDWMEMVEYPSVISFYQGKQINNGAAMINTYAFSGSEFAPMKEYYVTDDNLYHKKECDELTDEDRKQRSFSSRRELAAHGYSPCTKCRP